jgi:hypothetical protein
MTARALVIGWILVAVVALVLLGVEFSRWRATTAELSRAATERIRLGAEIRLKEEELVAEMRKHAGLVQEMQWSSAGADPSVFLTRLADLAREKRMTIAAVGGLERQTTPQFTKSWHSIQVRAPYRDLVELATRVERDRGVLEDLRIEPVPAAAGRPGETTSSDDLQARFKLTALELSPQSKLIVERTLAAAGQGGKGQPGAPPALPVPARPQAPPRLRDPFAFLTPPPPPGASLAGPARPAPALPEVALKGIVSFPDGFLAIVNNQIVRVGDTVTGYRVEKITENAVTLSVPGAPPRTIELPELSPVPAPSAPKR